MASISKQSNLWSQVMLIGDSAVGKSCIIHRQCEGTFTTQLVTLAPTFENTTILTDGRSMTITFVDTAGQERFNSLVPTLYRKADVFVLVYDITERTSFDRLSKWLNDINYHRQSVMTEDTNIMLIGNKADLKNDRKVSYEEGTRFAEENGMSFFETSAMTGENVNKAFQHLVNQLVERKRYHDAYEKFVQSVQLSASTSGRQTKRCSSCSSSPSTQPYMNLSHDSRRSRAPSQTTCTEPSIVQSCSTATDESGENPSTLNTVHLYLVRREIGSLTDWIDVGLELGLTIDTLREIKKDEKSVGDCTREMLAAWLEQKDQVESRGGPTWRQLATALRVYKHKALAKSLERKYVSRS